MSRSRRRFAPAEAGRALRLVLDKFCGAEGRAKWFPSRKKPMNATNILTPNIHLPIARIQSIHDLFALIPSEIHRLLLVIDPANPTEPALIIALGIAERWGSQITLIHGGRLSGWRETAEETAGTALMDLLCLSWQLKGMYSEISISQALPICLIEVLDEATKRKADLILLPEPLAARFRHAELTRSDDSDGLLPCPIVEVLEPESEWYR
jgi:hypothetical protein